MDSDKAEQNLNNHSLTSEEARKQERMQDLPTLHERKGRRPLTPEEERQKRIAYKIAGIFGILTGLFCLGMTVFYTFDDWVCTLLFSLLFIVPAYFSNSGMFAIGRKSKRTIDGGRKCRDGRPIFGPGKTWGGLLLGPLLIGVPLSMGVYLIFFFTATPILEFMTANVSLIPYKVFKSVDMMASYFWGCTTGYDIWMVGLPILVFRTFLIGYGAALGDLTAAFFKRRLNIGRGQPFWIVDQMDFQLGAVILGSIPSFLWPDIVPLQFWPVIVHLFVITGAIHIIANVVVYKLGLKAVPW